ncbi:MAG TPA: glycosyltransferase family 1 protein [Pyrinomonadaceae bacterium]|jgi:glycosyltransferase involved in cell wall biosynthesis|nr:glycosyltransferase family 1 protein [Pyrinomonadaceae bacterium]
MRVGLDAIPLATPRTGVGHYTFELARHLALIAPSDEFELVSPFSFAVTPIQTDDRLPANLRLVHKRVNSLRRRWFAVGLPLYIRQSAFDLFHGTNYEVPLWSRCSSILTIHDLSLFLHPATHEASLVRRGRRRLPIMARTASRIITPSESVRREVCEHLRIEPSKVVAIPEAPRDIFRPIPIEETIETRRRLQIEDEFILFVGTIEPRKNLLTLLKAFEEILGSTVLCPQLVIAGREGWLTDELFSHVRKSGVEDHLRFTGYLTDEDLCALYSSCRAFVYPSLYEGFGLPPLEAMACGAPVITSQIPGITETVGTTAARLISPTDIQALARSIIELLENENERRRLSSIGLQRAAQFSWERTARLTLEVYTELLRKK